MQRGRVKRLQAARSRLQPSCSPSHMKTNTGFAPFLLSISTILDLEFLAGGRRKSVTLVTRCALRDEGLLVSVLQVVFPCGVAKPLRGVIEYFWEGR